MTIQKENAYAFFNRPARLLAGVLLSGALLSGCASVQTAPEEKPRASLSERVQAYWAAVRIGDDVAAYPYEEVSTYPDMTLPTYLKGRGGVVYREINVQSTTLKGENEAEALIDMAYVVPVAGIHEPIRGQLKDRWIKIDGNWYHAKPESSLVPRTKATKPGAQ